MHYLGIDVHSIASVWCLLDEKGEIRARGKVETTVPALGELVAELSRQDALRVGQEVGTMAYLVHDAVTGAGVEILSFNAHPLRRIAYTILRDGTVYDPKRLRVDVDDARHAA